MKERRGTVARLAGLAEGVAAASRRRQRDRAPRVSLYDADGHPRLLGPDTRAFEEVLDVAERMLAAASTEGDESEEGMEAERASSTDGVSVPATLVDQHREADRGGTRDKG